MGENKESFMIRITIESEKYPAKLRKIKKPPKQLYLEGNIELLNQNAISIIGSRNCTPKGKKLTENKWIFCCVNVYTDVVSETFFKNPSGC